MERVHWTEDQWMKVIWSDESEVNKYGPDGRSYVWLPGASSLSAREVIPTFKFGGGGVMVWGCITAAGVGPLHFIDGILAADRYIEILHDHLLPTITAFSLLPSVPAPDELIFQQDNDPKHTAKRTKDWIKAQNINSMWWPAWSPDLNPIENVWYKLKTRLKSYDEPARDLVILKERIAEQRTLIPADDIHRLIRSMPHRCKAVIMAGGGQTKW